MKKTVFISSTYEDLKAYRKEVWGLLEKYDVHIQGMEEFGARSETPLETCLREVERSDIYVGIIAHKLGSLEAKSGKSFTRLEYEKAFNEGKEILIYLMDKDAEISSKHIDFDEKHEKLTNFKELLKEKHTVDFFKNEANLAKKLDKRFNELLTSKHKEKTEKGDPYSISKKTIEKFVIAPKLYNDKEITLSIQFKGSPYPISKELCNSFNLRYGRTIGVPIEITKPKETKGKINSIIIEEDLIDKFFEVNTEKEYEIIGRLIFTTQNIRIEKANFFDYTKTRYKVNPDFDPSLPATDERTKYLTISNPLSGINNPRYIETTENVYGEGKIIMLLEEINL